MRRAWGTIVRTTQLRRCRARWGDAVRLAWNVAQPDPADERRYRFQMARHPFAVRACDWYALREIALQRAYGVLDLLRAREPDIARIADLGANIGLFSLLCFSHWPAAEVHAVEAARRTFALLESNRRQNPQLRWHVEHAAIAAEPGEVVFQSSAFSTAGHLATAAAGQDGAAAERVPATTLPAFLERFGGQPVGLLKMDIEGAEEAALCAAPECLRPVRHLLVEVHPELCDAARVIATLRAAFPFIHAANEWPGGKPLLLATRAELPLPPYTDLAEHEKRSAAAPHEDKPPTGGPDASAVHRVRA